MSFYVTLPSNGSQKYFAENRITNYRIKLPSKLKFNPMEYEVALVEATYICSIKPLTGLDEDNVIRVQSLDSNWKNIIPISHYITVEDLVNAINLSRKSTGNDIDFHFIFDTKKKNVTIKLRENITIYISKKLSDILGFDGVKKFGSPTQDTFTA